jgi:hypothetical protein
LTARKQGHPLLYALAVDLHAREPQASDAVEPEAARHARAVREANEGASALSTKGCRTTAPADSRPTPRAAAERSPQSGHAGSVREPPPAGRRGF